MWQQHFKENKYIHTYRLPIQYKVPIYNINYFAYYIIYS